MQPASKAGSDKPASSAESNGAAMELKSEGVGKVRLYPHSCVALVWLSVESCLGQSAAYAECLHRSSLAWGVAGICKVHVKLLRLRDESVICELLDSPPGRKGMPIKREVGGVR